MPVRSLLAAWLLCLCWKIQLPGFTQRDRAGNSPPSAKSDTRKRTASRAKAQPSNPAPTIARQWLARMSLREKAAQLVIIPFYGENPGTRSAQYRHYAQQVRQLGVGGLIIINRVHQGVVRQAAPATMAAFLNRMQRLSRVPLIVAGDFERGASMRMLETTRFPHSMAFAAARDPEASRLLGAATAREARAMGVHWIFAPVADVNNNPDNPIINIRSYSENPAEVAEHVRAFIQGAHSDPKNRVLVTAKHFPGHGDTNIDSHYGLAKLDVPLERIEQMELPPFRAAIDAGVDAIMTAHLWVPALEPERIPATVSSAVLSGVLRRRLGFDGIITTDAMDMDGLAKQMPAGEAAVRAIEAGADVLLMPSSAQEAVRAVTAAVQQGRISLARLEASVMKLLVAKARLGLHQARTVPIEDISDALELPEDETLAQRVAEGAITLTRNEGRLVPLENPEASCWLMLVESRLGLQGRSMAEQLAKEFPKARRWLLDATVSNGEIEKVRSAFQGCESVVAAVWAGHRSAGPLPDSYTTLFNELLAAQRPLVLVALGNPYLLRSFPSVAAYMVTFSTTPASEVAVVHALAGRIAIRGKMPVSIPGLVNYGDGLMVAAAASSR
ncbi:MAG: glycoside hydrolase family 3 protein [Bryobacteraceae bacterium]|nr:glycoside hydrolase family 3 protein [Bryobacteraceae bacterium]MDW8377632.1 glycoside hydrolase family 3 protein [Bryobacterales bacterium]